MEESSHEVDGRSKGGGVEESVHSMTEDSSKEVDKTATSGGEGSSGNTKKKKELTGDEAVEEMHRWVKEGKLSESDTSILKVVVKDHDTQKEK